MLLLFCRYFEYGGCHFNGHVGGRVYQGYVQYKAKDMTLVQFLKTQSISKVAESVISILEGKLYLNLL